LRAVRYVFGLCMTMALASQKLEIGARYADSALQAAGDDREPSDGKHHGSEPRLSRRCREVAQRFLRDPGGPRPYHQRKFDHGDHSTINGPIGASSSCWKNIRLRPYLADGLICTVYAPAFENRMVPRVKVRY